MMSLISQNLASPSRYHSQPYEATFNLHDLKTAVPQANPAVQGGRGLMKRIKPRRPQRNNQPSSNKKPRGRGMVKFLNLGAVVVGARQHQQEPQTRDEDAPMTREEASQKLQAQIHSVVKDEPWQEWKEWQSKLRQAGLTTNGAVKEYVVREYCFASRSTPPVVQPSPTTLGRAVSAPEPSRHDTTLIQDKCHGWHVVRDKNSPNSMNLLRKPATARNWQRNHSHDSPQNLRGGGGLLRQINNRRSGSTSSLYSPRDEIPCASSTVTTDEPDVFAAPAMLQALSSSLCNPSSNMSTIDDVSYISEIPSNDPTSLMLQKLNAPDYEEFSQQEPHTVCGCGETDVKPRRRRLPRPFRPQRQGSFSDRSTSSAQSASNINQPKRFLWRGGRNRMQETSHIPEDSSNSTVLHS